ncbi:hypothetical protein POTOM_058775 [Populus tomentosa]|uniref:CCHC-type domain-containing protein n=1 Tax=Populus tomentosa TaxID=118781 RepID=A0A8X7XRL0_POPTO|nr:hypothetical protein POTOM_058775 [Populus tomentosa]
MSNALNERETLNGEKQENNIITPAEFRTFQQETQQTLQAIQATLARLTTGNNQRREDERVRDDHRERIVPVREHHPNPRRQLAYEEELSDDEEYAERILRPNRQGYYNMGERGPQSFHYEQILFQQYQDCRQGNRAVQAYVEEFHRLSSRNNLMETDAQQVARFIGGLRLNIQDRVSMHTIYTLTEAINLATKAETQLDRTRATSVARAPTEYTHTTAQKGKFPLNPPPAMTNFTRGPSTRRAQVTTAGVVPPEAPRNPYARPTSDKCYRCGQQGHRSNQCPKRGAVHLVEQGEGIDEAERIENETEYLYGEEEITGGDDGELLSRSLVVRRLLLAPKQMDHSQRHTQQKTHGKPILLVDGGTFITEINGASEVFAIVAGGEIGADPTNIPKEISGWILLMTNLILEIASAVFDQMGYALIGMVLAFVALLLAAVELIHMARKERTKREGLLPPFLLHATRKPVGTIVEYFGLAGAVWQCVYSTVEYTYTRQKKDNPIKMCLLPFIFLLCVAISKLLVDKSSVVNSS